MEQVALLVTGTVSRSGAVIMAKNVLIMVPIMAQNLFIMVSITVSIIGSQAVGLSASVITGSRVS